MKEYNDLATMVPDPSVPPVIKAFWQNLVGQMTASQTMGFVADFERDFGGQAYLVETLEDLKHLKVMEPTEDGLFWKSILEASDSFEQAAWLPGNEWALFWNASTNAGGPSYFVPAHIVTLCPNVADSMKMSTADGSVETLRIDGYDPVAP